MKHKIKTLIENKDYEVIRQLLSNNPNLANEGITIPYDSKCASKAHPLHRICDAVFAKKNTDEEAIEIAKILLEYGANIHYADREGATALHWAAFCGRDKLVERLIQEKAAIDQRDTSYNPP